MNVSSRVDGSVRQMCVPCSFKGFLDVYIYEVILEVEMGLVRMGSRFSEKRKNGGYLTCCKLLQIKRKDAVIWRVGGKLRVQ